MERSGLNTEHRRSASEHKKDRKSQNVDCQYPTRDGEKIPVSSALIPVKRSAKRRYPRKIPVRKKSMISVRK